MSVQENLVKLMELQRDLVGYDNLVQSGREFVREGCLQKLSRKGYQQRMFFLVRKPFKQTVYRDFSISRLFHFQIFQFPDFSISRIFHFQIFPFPDFFNFQIFLFPVFSPKFFCPNTWFLGQLVLTLSLYSLDRSLDYTGTLHWGKAFIYNSWA